MLVHHLEGMWPINLADTPNDLAETLVALKTEYYARPKPNTD